MFRNRCTAVLLNQRRICRYLGFSDESLAVAVPVTDQPEPVCQLNGLLSIDETSLTAHLPNGLSFTFIAACQVIITALFGVTNFDTGSPIGFSFITPGQIFSMNNHEPQTFTSLATQGMLKTTIGMIVATAVGQLDESSPCSQFFVLDLRPPGNPDKPDIIAVKIRVGNSFFDLKQIYNTSETPTTIRTVSTAPPIAACVICLSKKCSAVILPCRHMCLCRTCACEFRRRTTQCPLCRTEASALIDITDINSTLPPSTAMTIATRTDV